MPRPDYCISLKEQMGIKHTTIVRYHELAARIYPFIGHASRKMHNYFAFSSEPQTIMRAIEYLHIEHFLNLPNMLADGGLR
jgi:hypothetical protein